MDYAARAAAWQEEETEWPTAFDWQAPPVRPLQPPAEAPPLLISGGECKVNLFGVGANNAYLNATGVGLKKGPTGKAEYTFSKMVSLNIS